MYEIFLEKNINSISKQLMMPLLLNTPICLIRN